MSLWLFRRRSRRKRSVTMAPDAAGSDRPRKSTEKHRPARRQTAPDANLPSRDVTEKETAHKPHTESHKLHRRARAYSFSPDRDEKPPPKRESSRRSRRQSSLRGKSETGIRPAARGWREGADDKEQNGLGALGKDVFDRAPTLHNRRDASNGVSRKRSNRKRRMDDRQREAQIKAMTDFMPVRRATEDWEGGRPMRRESRRVGTGLSFGLRRSSKTDWDGENRSSEVSLPIPESIHSTLSSDSDQVAYKVSAFSALAPRPRLSYAASPRWSKQASADDTGLQQSQVLSRKVSIAEPIPEATLKAHKRVDDLANDLNASDLRELMERDKRRRERKKQKDQEKMERRLARRAEKQKEEEAAALRDGRDTPPNLERGVLGREAIGLGIDPASAVVTSSTPRSAIDGPADTEDKRKVIDGADIENVSRNPVAEFRRLDSVDGKALTPLKEQTPEMPLPASGTVKPRRSLRARLARSRSSRLSSERNGEPQAARRKSENVATRNFTWSSLFRWGRKSRRVSEPPSFSNTSRDSMRDSVLLNQQPAIPTTFVLPVRRASSGVPQRTLSRFREDLPELPRLPAQAKPQPEAIPPTITETSPDLAQADEAVSSPVESYTRNDTPTSGQDWAEAARQTPSSWSRVEEPNPSPEPHAMSLASIDSEGSWLSGGAGSRRRSSRLRESMTRAHHTSSDLAATPEPVDHDESSVLEDRLIADDEYLSSVAATPTADAPWKRKSVGEARPSSDEDEGGPRWGAVRGSRPNLVEGNRLKSREVLVNAPTEEDVDAAEAASPGSELDDDGVALQRAKSVRLSRDHVRHISAGSAKLLDITPRSSVEAKRRSGGLRPSV